MHWTYFLKTTDISETMKTRNDMFDVNTLTRDTLRIINAHLRSDCVMIMCSSCKETATSGSSSTSSVLWLPRRK